MSENRKFFWQVIHCNSVYTLAVSGSGTGARQNGLYGFM